MVVGRGVAVGDADPVGLGVCVAAGVAVLVEVAVGDWVGVRVGVGVGVGVLPITQFIAVVPVSPYSHANGAQLVCS